MNADKEKIAIVIPVYNHARSLRGVVLKALAVHDTVMVVDDGSTDGGCDTLQGLNILLLQHPVNSGKGSAILTAAKEARRLGMTHLVTIDADGQHDPAEFSRFASRVKSDPHAIVIGKRNFQTKDVPGLSRFGRHFSNFWLRLQTGQKVGDTQSGYRCYPLSVLEKLKLRENGYAFEVEVLVKAAWAGIALREVDISVYYPPESERISHFNVFWDNVRLSLLNTRLTLRSFVPYPHRRILDREKGDHEITIWHPIRSLKTLLTENWSPGQLATAGAMGVFLGTLPLIGLHTITILFAAGFFRLNKLAAVGTSQFCMPPLIPALCIETGYFMRHGEFLTEVSLQTLGYQGLERIFEWIIGSLVLAPIISVVIWCCLFMTAIILKRSIRASI